MKRSPEEKARLRAQILAMKPAERAEYIWTYYKWPIILGLIALIILGNGIHRHLNEKDTVLCVGLCNVTVGSELEQRLGSDYVRARGMDERKTEILFFKGLYLSDDAGSGDHQYAYASRLKVMAAVNSKQLDAVIMNRSAYDLLSGSGYLMELTQLFPELSPDIAKLLTENAVITADNSVEYDLGEAEEHIVESVAAVNAVGLTSIPLFRSSGLDGDVYLGIIANTAKADECLAYLEYLLCAE